MDKRISQTNICVRYAETDRMGIVYHSNYYPWFDIARSDMLKGLGGNYAKMEEMGVYMPLVDSYAKYLKPLTYDEEVTVNCRLTKLSYCKCVFCYEVIRNKDNEIMTKGKTTHAFCDGDLKPVNLKKKLPEYFELFKSALYEFEE